MTTSSGRWSADAEKNLRLRAFGWLFLILGLCVLAYVATLSSSYRRCVADYAKTNTEKEQTNFFEVLQPLVVCEGVTIDANGELLTAVATIFIAIFTLTLWRATEEQGRLTRKSLRLTRRSVDAAEASERAYVYPVVTDDSGIESYISGARVHYMDEFAADGSPNADRPVPETAELFFALKNYGKTPAILKKVFASLGVAPLGSMLGHSIPIAILGVGDSTSEFIAKTEIGLTRNQARHIYAYERFFCLSGLVTFDDIWGSEHTTTFSFSWDIETKRMTLGSVHTETKGKDDGLSKP